MAFEFSKRGSIFIPRDAGRGWTLDYSHPGTWLLFLLFLALAAGIPYLMLS